MKADSLQAIIVKATMRPKIKGDTVEYNTTNIRLKPNAVIEELLGRLPGLQIDANGNISFNGEKIQKLLVDGEDIFGSDPSIVTRNLNADMIDRVQITDSKSEQAKFTGIDDGTRTKTLNLVLKESVRNGYFGKLEGGGGTKATYNANGLIGSFVGLQQFTALGLASNSGITGTGGGAGDAMGGLSVLSGATDPLGGSAGSGIPKVAASALHYANTWSGSQRHVAGNYQLGHLITEPFTSSLSVQSLPDSQYVQSGQGHSINNQNQQQLNAVYDYSPNGISAYRLTVDGAKQYGQNQFASLGTSAFNNMPVNSNSETIQSNGDNRNLNIDLFGRLNSQKNTTRAFSIIAGVDEVNNKATGYLYNLDRFYQPGGGFLSSDTVDQYREIYAHTLGINGSLNYTEPLWKNNVLASSWGLSLTDDSYLQSTFGKADGKYQDFIDGLSSHYKDRTLIQQGTLNLQGTGSRLTYTLGASILSYTYRQQNLLMDSLFHLRYLNVTPKVVSMYSIDTRNSLVLNYESAVQRPSITQLHPVLNNNDPLHITLGNPDLHPIVQQKVKLQWTRSAAVLLNIGLFSTFSTSAISSKTSIDSLGREVTQPVNTSGIRAYALLFHISKKLTPWDINAQFNTALRYDRSVNYINNQLSQNEDYNPEGGLILTKYVADKYSVQISTNFNYFYSRSSVNPGAPTHYWTQDNSVQLSIFPSPGLEISSDGNYTWQEKTNVFGKDISVFLWNSFVSQNFLKNKLMLKLSAINILNQNSGISRSISLNTSIQTTTNTVGRYVMLSAIYHFEHRKKLSN